MIETNLHQRSFDDMLPTEKAAVLRYKYDKLYAQGRRNDIIRELNALWGEPVNLEEPTRSDAKLGREYGLSRASVSRLIRLNELTDGLKTQVDAGALSLDAAECLSHLMPETQAVVEQVLMEQPKAKLTKNKALRLRELEEGQAGRKQVQEVICGSQPTMRISISPALRCKYFSSDTSNEEVVHIIDRALALFFSAQNEADNERS